MKDLLKGLQRGKFSITVLLLVFVAFSIFACNQGGHKGEEDGKQGGQLLTMLTIASQVRQGEELKRDVPIGIGVPYDLGEVDVITQTRSNDVKLTFEPPLENGKLQLTGSSTTLKIFASKGDQSETYTILAKNIIQGCQIAGGRKRGELSQATPDEVVQVLQHAKNTITLSGPVATIYMASKTLGIKSFKINGMEFKPFPVGFSGFQYAVSGKFPIGNKTETKDVKIEIEADELDSKGKIKETVPIREVFNLKITRNSETVDVPATKLIIGREEKIKYKDENYIALNKDAPEMEIEAGNKARVKVHSDAKLKSVLIDGGQANIEQREEKTNLSENPVTVWYAQNEIDGATSGTKEIKIVMDAENTDDYHKTTWGFKLTHKNIEVIPVSFELNGQDEWSLPFEFTDGLQNNTNPKLDVAGAFLNIYLNCGAEVQNIKINDATFDETKLKKIEGLYGANYLLFHSVKLDNEQKNILIEVNPKYTGEFLKKTFKFVAKGNGALETLTPTFEQINNDSNLPVEDFVNKLTTDKPTYKVYGKTTKLIISFSKYQKEFCLKQVKVNGQVQSLNEVTDEYNNTKYVLVSEINIEGSSKDVVIDFIAKEGIADNLQWKFKLECTEEKPTLQSSKISWFRINKFGSIYYKFAPEFIGHITDGTSPEFSFDGKRAKVQLGAYDTSFIKDIEFKMDGKTEASISPTQQGYLKLAIHTFVISDANPHPVQIIVNPADESVWAPLVYSFTLKSTLNKIPPEVRFIVDDQIRQTGYNETLEAECATLLLQSKEDVIGSVEIGEVGNLSSPQVEKHTDASGNFFWEAKKRVHLDTETGKVFVLKVTPKDTNEYLPVECRYTLKGTAIGKQNAEFKKDANERPIVLSNIDWKEGLEGNNFVEAYGAQKLVLEAHTKSPRAHVKAQFVDPLTDLPLQDSPVIDLSVNEFGEHISSKISLLEYRPTKMKIWVVAQDNSTVDAENGQVFVTYNPILLNFGYEKKPESIKYPNKAYGEVEVEKEKVKADGKIYLVFGIWKEDYGYTVDNSNLTNKQSKFLKLEAVDDLDYYRTAVDVKSILERKEDYVEAYLNIKLENKHCFTYKVKIKLR